MVPFGAIQQYFCHTARSLRLSKGIPSLTTQSLQTMLDPAASYRCALASAVG
jgi:hypothetical protein